MRRGVAWLRVRGPDTHRVHAIVRVRIHGPPGRGASLRAAARLRNPHTHSRRQGSGRGARLLVRGGLRRDRFPRGGVQPSRSQRHAADRAARHRGAPGGSLDRFEDFHFPKLKIRGSVPLHQPTAMLHLVTGSDVAGAHAVSLDRDVTLIGRSSAAHVPIHWDGASREHAR